MEWHEVRGTLDFINIDLFCTDFAQAPGEAEAELASLNRKGYIDAIQTDDCDAFIFGAQTIIKK